LNRALQYSDELNRIRYLIQTAPAACLDHLRRAELLTVVAHWSRLESKRQREEAENQNVKVVQGMGQRLDVPELAQYAEQ
jgi:hypothetical protein